MQSATAKTLALLKQYESRNITYISPEGGWPIVWKRAVGDRVWDVENKPYVDLTAAFGVAAAGHANPRVVRAGQKQMATLLHAMGDVHPHPGKGKLARELSRLTFERWSRAVGHTVPIRGKCILCSSGFEAVEAALKTAFLATGRRGVVAFKDAYHGLGYGALNATYRSHFRAPFAGQLGEFGLFVDFPSHPEQLAQIERQILGLIRKERPGAILVEPVQARGGIHVPPVEFLPGLRRICDAHGLLLLLDEVYTGMGRTGKWFACEHSGVMPDILCLGKALTGGFPLSACVGKANVMDRAWPPSTGEAIHTSTFLGHPVGCAMALAQIAEIRRQRLVDRSARLGRQLQRQLAALTLPKQFRASVRGVGLLVGLSLETVQGKPATQAALALIEQMLHRGFILLPEGADANVISFSPPLTISPVRLNRAVSVLQSLL